MSNTRFCIAVCAAMLALTTTALAQQPPTPVRADAVRAETLQQQRQVTGNVRAVTRSRIAAIEPGRVLQLPVEEGQIVREGDKLAVIDGTRLEIELQQIQANIAVQEATIDERTADVKLRESDLQMLESLEQRGAINPKELSDARLEHAAAQARLTQAQRQLEVQRAQADLLRQRLRDMVITAPFDGTIVAKLTERGQWLAEGSEVLELMSTGVFDVWLDVPQRYANALNHDDLSLIVHVDAVDHQYTATNARIIGDVSAVDRTFSLVVRIDQTAPTVPTDEQTNIEQPPHIAPGMSVTAWIPAGDRREQLTVHKDAVLRNEAGAYVFAVRDGDQSQQAVPTRVDVLYSLAERYVVESNELRDGVAVVIEGNERLQPMAAVRIVNDGPDNGERVLGDDD